MKLIELIKNKLSGSRLSQLRKILACLQYYRLRSLLIKPCLYAYKLEDLASYFGTDKWGSHFYIPQYEAHLRKFRFRKIKLLEIGVGGYEHPEFGGNSLRMWKRYFPLGRIYSLDIYDKSRHEESRIKIFKGSQIDKQFLEHIVKETGELDIIIDDGSHINAHVIETFTLLFPALKHGGVYVVEDTQTSYWPNQGGSSENLNQDGTTMNWFKRLADGLNYREFRLPNYKPTYFDQTVVSIHFYHNLVFVYKGDNLEESNVVKHAW